MFEEDLESLPTRDLLEGAADCRAIASQADARLLECAQIYADRFHPSACQPRPSRRAYEGRERAVVLGGDGCPEIAEFAIAEFAVVLGVSPGVGSDILADALALRHRFPRTWARIQAGEATPWKARQIVQACRKLDHAAAEYVDRKVAAIVDTLPPYRLEKIARAARKHADPARAAAETAEAADDRGVHVGRGDGHGNKTIYIKAPAAAVNHCNATITDIAEALKKLGDTRPVQHRRADAIDILSDPAFTQELLARARNLPHPPPPDPTTSPTTPQPDTNHEPHTPTTPDNPAAPTHPPVQDDAVVPDNSVVQDNVVVPDNSVVQDNVVVQNDVVVQDPVLQDDGVHDGVRDAVVPDDAVVPIGESGGYGTQANSADLRLPGSRRLPNPLGSADSLERPRSLEPTDLLESPGSLDLVEPVGPPDDPWLEAAAPCDLDPPADPFDRRTPAHAADSVADVDVAACDGPGAGSAMDAAALRVLRAKLAQIKQDAYANPSYPTHPDSPPDPGSPADAGSSGESTRSGVPARLGGGAKGQVRPGQTEVVVHLTDHTLATGCGVLRAEAIGPLLAAQLTELVGFGPYTVKPVIDLNDAVSVDAYEIPTRIRERVKLMYPAEQFPYGTRETTNTIDLDHIEPYDPHGPTGQTGTANLAPLGRFGHRVKTHARGWSVRRIDDRTLEWRTPHGFTFHVDPDGTHRVDP